MGRGGKPHTHIWCNTAGHNKRPVPRLAVQWFTERAETLTVFRHELVYSPPADNFKLAYLISKLDPKDREWAMKETDIAALCEFAMPGEQSAAKIPASAPANAEAINYRSFVFPIA